MSGGVSGGTVASMEVIMKDPSALTGDLYPLNPPRNPGSGFDSYTVPMRVY